ncbi:MAG: hypothetical protein AAF802_12100 [Planctomycetota bacterium]
MNKAAPSGGSVDSVLRSVTNRIRARRALQGASLGLAAGSIVAMTTALIAVGTSAELSSWIYISLLTVATVLGATVGALLPAGADKAAQIVDRCYGLKDRVVSSLQFQGTDDPVHQLQVEDAQEHLRDVDPQMCVTVEPRRAALWTSVAACSVAGLALWLPKASEGSVVDAEPVKLAIDQADTLRNEMLEDLEELREEFEEPELEELNEELEELIEKLASESIDERDMMATLSEMEQAIESAHEKMKIAQTDAQLQSLASAIEPAEAMKAAAAAMKEGKYDSASEKLEKVDPNEMKDSERRAVAANLKKFLAKLDPAKNGKLSGAAKQIVEGLESKSSSKCKDGMCNLAKLCKSQSQCKKIGECMACQLNRLAQCKSQCRGQCNKNGGNGASKSDSPKNSWGRGATGKANDGEATKIESIRTEEQLTGQQGDGPSESEFLEAPEGEQDAARVYAKKYQEFRNQAEAVLDQEPLPLGHRETVREYFESIRPDRDFESAKE